MKKSIFISSLLLFYFLASASDQPSLGEVTFFHDSRWEGVVEFASKQKLLVSIGAQNSLIQLDKKITIDLPVNTWIRSCVFSELAQAAILLIYKTSDKSPGFWYWGALAIHGDAKGIINFKFCLLAEHLATLHDSDITVESVESCDNFPFAILKTSTPLGRDHGPIIDKLEKWNVLTNERIKSEEGIRRN